QDRLKQKAFLERSKIPTAPFSGLMRAGDAQVFFEKQKNGVVFKKRRFGYDGYGTFIVRTQNELNQFLADQESYLSEFIVESYIPFQRELAVTLVRSSNGEVMMFPLVEWKAKDSKCFWVKGPV